MGADCNIAPGAALIGRIAVCDFQGRFFKSFLNRKGVSNLLIMPTNLSRGTIGNYAIITIHETKAVDFNTIAPSGQFEGNIVCSGLGDGDIMHQDGHGS